MPNKGDRQFQRALETVERLRAKANGHGKGQSKAASEVSHSDAWTCRGCGYYNFGTRRRCRLCPIARPGAQPAASSSAGPPASGKGGGGGAKGNGAKGGGRKDGGASDNNWHLRAQLKLLEEQNRALKQSLADKSEGDADKDEEEELVADDAEDEAAVNADLENLAALQRCYDAALVQLGADDEAAKTLRGRLDAARAKQRAGKPIFQQVQTAQRKTTRHERLHEAAKAKLQELELRKAELEKEIMEQSAKVAAAHDDLTKSKLELGGLLERAKAEKGTAPAAATAPNGEGATPPTGGIHGAAAAWNVAKAAIQQQVAALAADIAPEVQQAVAAQYAAMEAVLNRIPAPAPPVPPTAPPPRCDEGEGGQSGDKTAPPAEASLAAATATAATTAGSSSGGMGTTADDDGGAEGMLDVDEAVLEKLAEIFTAGGDGTSATDDVADDDADAADEPAGDGSRKSRRIMDSRVTAARQLLAGKIRLRKQTLKHGPKGK